MVYLTVDLNQQLLVFIYKPEILSYNMQTDWFRME